MAVLAVAAPAGATTLTLTGPTSPASWMIVGQNTPQAELCKTISVIGKTVKLVKPLAYPQPAKCVVAPFDGGLIPWTWFGGRADDQAAASGNVESFNRLTQSIHDTGGATGIFVATGFYINNELKLERDQVLEGSAPGKSAIAATADFPFDDTGEVAMIHVHRDGNPATFQVAGPSGRWFMRNLFVTGNNVPNSCGILSSPQQPDAMENVRVDKCAGTYGIGLSDVQDFKMTNIQLVGNQCAMYLKGVSLFRVFGLNIEQGTGPSLVKLESSSWGSFYGVHLEHGSESVAFNHTISSTGIGIQDLFYSNAQTGTAIKFDCPRANPGSAARYVLSNIWCNANSNDYKMVDDIQRGKSLNSFSDTDRWIDYLTPRVLMDGYVKTS